MNWLKIFELINHIIPEIPMHKSTKVSATNERNKGTIMQLIYKISNPLIALSFITSMFQRYHLQATLLSLI